jgi:hypothetical protein
MVAVEELAVPGTTGYRRTMPPDPGEGIGADHGATGRSTPSPPGDAGTEKVGRRWWPWVLAVLVVLGVASVATPAGRHQWGLSFVRQPTDYTSLSFVDAAHLPTTVPEGSPLHLAFTVANQEGRDLDYPYSVTSASRGQVPVLVGHDVLFVPAGAQRSAAVAVVPDCTASPCQVQISLLGHAEAIHVLVDVDGSPS